jgi:hypothetical protein
MAEETGGEIVTDFVQTMNNWRRMCQFMDKEYGNSSCDKCPLGGCSAVYEMCGKENFSNMEHGITAWAAEHTVVYPTWEEWLSDKYNLAYNDDFRLAMSREYIPADIAQKLGIEPKEG